MASTLITRRQMLGCGIVLISAVGCLALTHILFGKLGRMTENLLLSLICFGAAVISIVIFSISGASHRRRLQLCFAVIITVFAMLTAMMEIWVSRLMIGAFLFDPEDFAVASWAAVGYFVLSDLFSMARLRKKYVIVQEATKMVLAIFVLQVVLTVLTEMDIRDEWRRLVATFAVLGGVGSLSIPILHLISKAETRKELLTSGISFPMTCPRCQRSQEISIGRSKCAGCGLKFSIEIEEEHCGKCGYPLYQIRSGQCPECGTPFLADAAQLPTAIPSA